VPLFDTEDHPDERDGSGGPPVESEVGGGHIQ
jgi:hypothetical protein